MRNSAQNATPPKSNKSRNSNSSVQIHIKPKSYFEFVLRDSKESEVLDLADFGDAAFGVETAETATYIHPRVWGGFG